MSIFIVDTAGNKLGSSTTDEVEQSVIVDQYGQHTTTGNLVINNHTVTRNDQVHGFYRLNDVHDSIKGTWMCPSDAEWKRYAPNRWYLPANPNVKLNGFFNEMAGYCTINQQSHYNATGANQQSDNYQIADKVNIPTYVMFDPAGKLNYTDIESSTKPYPIKVIRGGTSPGTYGPILTVIKYAAWISPALELKVYDTYNRMNSFTGDMVQLLTESKLETGDLSAQYHSIKEAEYRFNTQYNADDLERECIGHKYGISIAHDYTTGNSIRVYHRDIWWLSYKIPADKW